MTPEVVTPDQVQELYKKYSNKQYFLCMFGTTKFYTVDQTFLERMYNYLVKKVK